MLILAKEALEEVIHETEDLVIIFPGGVDCPSELPRKN